MAALPPPLQRPILHFTHVKHLPSIISGGAILADSVVGAALQTEVGDQQIKAARRVLNVTPWPGGHPCDYVPFYFAPRSPMLYKIAVGGVPQYQEGQTPLVYLLSSIGHVVGAGLTWLFSDGNCGANLTGYYNDIAQLDTAIDWPLQSQAMWNSTADDPTRATRRAAEFLVHQAMPWGLVTELVVRTPQAASLVRSILDGYGQTRPVSVRGDWYYTGAKYK